MKIALDFDGTWTEDPELWKAFCVNARIRGHTVHIVTMRDHHGKEEVEQSAELYVDGIVLTDGKQKRAEAAAQGYMFDVWIDDCPESISQPVIFDGSL